MEKLYADKNCGCGLWCHAQGVSMASVGIKYFRIVFVSSVAFMLLFAVGCNIPAKSSAAQIRAFEKAGPITPKVDINLLVKSRIHSGPYKVVPGDIIELRIPLILQTVSSNLPASLQESKPYLCRVSDAGYIALPIIGEVDVANKTLAEIEALVIDAYYPKYVVNSPVVVCTVTDYRVRNITVAGAVAEPGTYPLRNDEMSLVSVLMKAGGIVEGGARYITIKREERWWADKVSSASVSSSPDEAKNDLRQFADGEERAIFVSNFSAVNTSSQDNGVEYEFEQSIERSEKDYSAAESSTGSDSRRADSKPIVLPIKGLNVPFSDVALQDGDIIEVERIDPQIFTVMGLVNKPGAFDYPPDIKYNLVQALAFAGGLNLVADPHYASIYRQDADDRIVSATFKISGKHLADAANVAIKPGDVINLEVTPRTRTNLLLDRMLRFNVGVYVRPLDD